WFPPKWMCPPLAVPLASVSRSGVDGVRSSGTALGEAVAKATRNATRLPASTSYGRLSLYVRLGWATNGSTDSYYYCRGNRCLKRAKSSPHKCVGKRRRFGQYNKKKR